tara:strand:- start:3759 stop:5513 length:1755 start_codon:yes stop_codon:yes gene_type:complete
MAGGFWGGFGRAMESNEQQRNVENERSDRQAEIDKRDAREKILDSRYTAEWDNTLAQQKAARDADAAALKLDADRDRRDYNLKAVEAAGSLTGVPVKSSGTNSTTTNTGGTTKQDLESTLLQLVTYGAQDQHLLDLAGGGNAVAAKALTSYQELQKIAEDNGDNIDVNEYLATAITTTAPGEEVDLYAMADMLGISQEDLDTQGGLKAALARQLARPDISTVRFEYQYVEPMEPTEYNPIIDRINANLNEELSGKIGMLQREEDETGKDNTVEIGLLSDARDQLKEGDSFNAFKEIGIDAIRPWLEDASFMKTNVGGAIERVKDQYRSEMGAVDSAYSTDPAIMEQYGITEADIPQFNTEWHTDENIDEYLAASPDTPYIIVDGELLPNSNVVAPTASGATDAPADAIAPADPTMPADPEAPAGLGGPEAGSPADRRAGLDRGNAREVPDDRISSVGSQGRQRGAGDGEVSVPFPFRSTTAEEVAGRPQKEDRRRIPEEAPTGQAQPGSRPQDFSGIEGEFRNNVPQSEGGTIPNAAIQEEDGQMLLDYIKDGSTPPEMLDAMAEEFKQTYGEQALFDLMATLN